MIGLPTSAPRSYGNPHNLSAPGVANNRTGANVQQTKKTPMLMQGPAQQQHQQIGFAPGGAMPPEQQPMYNNQQRQIDPMMLMAILGQPQQQMSQQLQQPQRQPLNSGGPGLSFGKQYYEQAMPLG